VLNALASFEERTAITDLGEVTTPWGLSSSIGRFIRHSGTWDWPMFQGEMSFFRVIGFGLTAIVGLGIGFMLAQLLMNSIGSVLRTFRP